MKSSTIALGALAVLATSSSACTTVSVPTSEGDVVGRTMELGGDLHDKWIGSTHARGEEMGFGGNQICGAPTWTNKHGFFSIDLPDASLLSGFPSELLVTDGMNEAGLSASAQVLQASAGNYMVPDNSTSSNSTSVCWLEMVPWLLANFASVDELKSAFGDSGVAIVDVDTSIYPKTIMPMVRGLHWGVDDAQGNHVVLEVLGGTLHISDNTVGVLTNDPPFAWHLDNLRQYSNFSPRQGSPSSVAVDTEIGMVPMNAPGFGFNLQGMPGSFTPADRFVRMFYLKQHAGLLNPLSTIAEGVTVATGLLADTFIVKGTMPDLTTTTYSVLKVPSKQEYYYKTYDNSQWKRVQLSVLKTSGAFAEGASLSSDALSHKGPSVVDVTGAFSRQGAAAVDSRVHAAAASKVSLRGSA
jgi:choloylglycine hydrolase